MWERRILGKLAVNVGDTVIPEQSRQVRRLLTSSYRSLMRHCLFPAINGGVSPNRADTQRTEIMTNVVRFSDLFAFLFFTSWTLLRNFPPISSRHHEEMEVSAAVICSDILEQHPHIDPCDENHTLLFCLDFASKWEDERGGGQRALEDYLMFRWNERKSRFTFPLK